MINLEDTPESPYYVSTSILSSCNHTIQWESQATIRVTLTKNSGSLPVNGTALVCRLFYTGSTPHVLLKTLTKVTPPNGEVHISFLVNSTDTNLPANTIITGEDQLELRIEPSKTSDNITHEYLCDNQSTVCGSSAPHRTSLSHLGLVDIQISDKTVIPVKGTIYIGKKEDNSLIPTECVLGGAEVCLKRVVGTKTDPTLDCTKTGELVRVCLLQLFPTHDNSASNYTLVALL